MLDKVKDLKGYGLHALDGHIGSVAEFYFDDRHWTVRYLVADTGSWLSERQVLISPYAIDSVNRYDRTISVNMTRKQIEDGPVPEADLPISRQFEESYHKFYSLPSYWDGSFAWGACIDDDPSRDQLDRIRKVEQTWDHHLRSTKDVTGYDLRARDGEIGHVEDFIVEDSSWAFRYIVVDTGNWLPGKQVLVSPRWIEDIEWADRKVSVVLTREAVRNSPEYTAAHLLTRDYETRLHGYYDRAGYWDEDLAGVKHTY
jgi:hypothetical protein